MTREEAIEKVRQWSLPKETREILEALAPELRESEDERIRKELIEFIREAYSTGNAPEKCAKWLVWLEKQKEQEEIPLMNGDADLYFDNWIQHNDTTKRGCFEEGMRYAQRLQKEQKPAEWSEEDRKMIDHLIEALPMWANGRIAMLPSQADEYVERLKKLI